MGHSLGNEFKVRDAASGEIDKGEYIEIDYVKNAESMGAHGSRRAHAGRGRATLSKPPAIATARH